MKANWLVILLVIIILGLLGFLALSGQIAPAKELNSESQVQQLVYNAWAFTGQRYDSVFYPQSEDTIYLISDVDNVIVPKLTEVYYWPLSLEYRANWTALNEKLTGVVRILQNERVVANLTPVDYSLLYSDLIPHTITFSSEAQNKYQDYLEETRRAADELDAYYQEDIQYQIAYENYLNEIKQGNLDVAPPEPPPNPPSTLNHYVSKPETAYHINLPPGDYELELRTLEGNLVQTSRKKLHVFPARQQSIGYKVFLSERWTQPDVGAAPRDVFYTHPGETLFIQPYLAKKFSRYDYAKLRNPQQLAVGRYAWQWILADPVENGQIQLMSDNEIQEIVPFKSFIVRQNPGPALGYAIDLFDQSVAQGVEPTFSAFKFTVPDIHQIYKFALRDSSGELVQGSTREIRVITERNLSILYAFAFLPLLFGVINWGLRRFRFRKFAETVEVVQENSP